MAENGTQILELQGCKTTPNIMTQNVLRATEHDTPKT
jgi:hypothetical protein